MGVYLRDNMGCMTDFGYVILATNLLMFMTIQACKDTWHRSSAQLTATGTVNLGLSGEWISGGFNSTCSCTPLTAGGISKQFRDLEVCFEISPAGRVSQEQVELNRRKKETVETRPLAVGQPASACMQNSEFMHA